VTAQERARVDALEARLCRLELLQQAREDEQRLAERASERAASRRAHQEWRSLFYGGRRDLPRLGGELLRDVRRPK
jgi:hypothetical protein